MAENAIGDQINSKMLLSPSPFPSLSRFCLISAHRKGANFCHASCRGFSSAAALQSHCPHSSVHRTGRRCLHGKGPIKALPVPDGKFDILFFGGDEFSCLTLRKLEQAKDVWRTLEVVTQSDRQRTHHGKKTVESPVRLLAQELALRCHFLPNEKAEIQNQTFPSPFDAEQHTASQLLIVSSLGRYIAWNVLKRFQSSRRLNIHPSMIPRYRGAAPIQWAIVDGLDETGVSVIEVEKVSLGYDVGDIWAQKPVVMPAGSTYGTLMPILAEEGSALLLQVLRRMIDETQTDSIEQDTGLVTHALVIHTVFALVDWWKQDAKKIDQVSRAITHQKPIFTYVLDEETTLQLHDTFVLPEQSHSETLTECGQALLNEATGYLHVRCSSGSQLAVKRVKQRNRKLMTSKEWWIGLPAWKKPGGILTFHMGPYRDSYFYPGFHGLHKVA